MNEQQPSGEIQGALQPVTPPSGKIFRMPRFFPGVRVRYAGRDETISHIVISRQLVSVHLIGREIPVRPDELELEPTTFTTARKFEPLLS